MNGGRGVYVRPWEPGVNEGMVSRSLGGGPLSWQLLTPVLGVTRPLLLCANTGGGAGLGAMTWRIQEGLAGPGPDITHTPGIPKALSGQEPRHRLGWVAP